MILRWFIFISVLLNSSASLFAQDLTSVRLTVLSGGNLDFIFNSMSEYKNGVSLPYANYTTFAITITDDPLFPIDYQTWTISAEAEDPEADNGITGTGGTTIPFGAIELSAAASGVGCGGCVFPPPLFHPLQNPTFDGMWNPVMGTGAGDVLVNGGPADAVPAGTTSYQISISYQCGVTIKLLGYAPDYYSDGIFFTLIMNP